MMDRVRKYNLSTGYPRPLQTRYCSLRHTTRCCLRIKSIAFPIHWTLIPKDEVYFKFVLSRGGGLHTTEEKPGHIATHYGPHEN